MAYRILKSIFHQKNRSAAEMEEAVRRSSPAAVHWEFSIEGSSMFCLLTPEIVVLIERIMILENRARKLWTKLPGGVRHHYLRSMIIEEIYASNEIEAVHSTRQEIAETIDSLQRETPAQRHRFQEIARLYGALSEGVVASPRTLDDLLQVYAELTEGEISDEEAPDGVRFRAGTVQILDGQKVVHQGAPSEEQINAGLREMLRQSRDEDIPQLIRAVAAHFIFENVHPFYDGNGRTGRYLLAVELSASLSPMAWLSLSATINDNKQRYYKAFQDAEQPLNRGDATVFIAEMLDIIAEAQGRLCVDLESRSAQMSLIAARILKLKEQQKDGTNPALAGLPDGVVDLLFVLGQEALFGVAGEVSLSALADTFEKSKQYIRPRTKTLIERGVIAETSGSPLRFRLTEPGRDLLGLDL